MLALVGDPGVARTRDTQFRKLLLYPPELRGRWRRVYHTLWASKAALAPLSGPASGAGWVLITGWAMVSEDRLLGVGLLVDRADSGGHIEVVDDKTD